jgi:hypothetical protein
MKPTYDMFRIDNVRVVSPEEQHYGKSRPYSSSLC